MKFIQFLQVACALLFVTHTIAQTDSLEIKETDSIPTMNIWRTMAYDGKSAWGGFKNAFTQPARWQKDDFITAGSILAGTYILYTIDTDANRFFARQEEDAPQILKDFGWYFGSPQNNYGVMGGIYLVGLVIKNEKVRRTGVLMITAASAAGLIQSVSKTVVGRARPDTGLGKHTFDLFSNEAGFHSFPSGHTVLSFTTAHVLAKQFDSIWIKSGIYAAGLIAPVSRLWAGAHWLTDVALGAAISIVVVDGIDNFLYKEKRYSEDLKPRKVSWNMRVGAGTIGFVGTF